MVEERGTSVSKPPYVWGATTEEAERPYPADDLVAGPSVALTRAVDVAAPVAVTWRWLCQLALAPYSYDLVDNLGRRSPRTLTPGADDLVVGQRMATVFTLTDVEPGHQWTGRMLGGGERWFGPTAVTYAAEPAVDADRSRIVCRMVVGMDGRVARVRATPLAWGDLVMMRKQLLTLRDLAESTSGVH